MLIRGVGSAPHPPRLEGDGDPTPRRAAENADARRAALSIDEDAVSAPESDEEGSG